MGLGEPERLGDAEALADGLGDADGLSDGLGDADGLSDGLGDADGLSDTLGDGLGDADGLSDTLGDGLGDADGLSDASATGSATPTRWPLDSTPWWRSVSVWSSTGRGVDGDDGACGGSRTCTPCRAGSPS